VSGISIFAAGAIFPVMLIGGQAAMANAADCLVGMHVTPSDELRQALRTREDEDGLDNQTALREKRRIAEEFRQQLTFGVPTNDDEAALAATLGPDSQPRS
jgi:hypothetical protein